MTPAELSRPEPSVEVIDALATNALARLPSPFQESLADLVLVIEEVVDRETALRLGLQHPMQLSGLYEGVPLNRQSVSQSGLLPERITLYRQPIISEWRATRFSLEQIVSHIVIHEVGHHFGFSDDEIHALEQEAE